MRIGIGRIGTIIPLSGSKQCPIMTLMRRCQYASSTRGGAMALLVCILQRQAGFIEALRPAIRMMAMPAAAAGSSIALYSTTTSSSSSSSRPIGGGGGGWWGGANRGGGSSSQSRQNCSVRRLPWLGGEGGRGGWAGAATILGGLAATSTTSSSSVASSEGEKQHHTATTAASSLNRRPKVVFVLGGPGAGKGTQCEKLVSQYGFIHLSAGDLLRRERSSGSPDGQLIDEHLVQGKIVPVRVSLNLLRKEMEASTSKRFLIDGFPRNFDNVQGWEELMEGVADVEAVLAIDCPEDVLIERLLKRGETSGRTDDNIESAVKRFHIYNEATRPVIEYYDSKGVPVHRIPGQLVREAVFARIKSAIDPLIEKEVLECTHKLLDSIAEGDWSTYARLCDKNMTCFEPEARGHLVTGLDFHKFYFENGNALGAKHTSTISQPHVRVMGRTATVNYIRVVQKCDQSSGAASSMSHEETRVWELKQETGSWQCVHFHRSPSH